MELCGGLTYYGGKAGLAETIVGLMPPHRIYVEPFAGGLSVLFRKPPAQLEVVNDKDERIANAYRVLQADPEARELVARLWLTPYSRTEHARARRALKDPEATAVEKAWGAIVDLGMGINAKFGSGFRTSTGGGRGPSTTIQSDTWTKQLQSIMKMIPRLRTIEVEQRDALKVIRMHDGPDTLVYADPPYPGSDQGHYKGYSMEDFRALWSLLSSAKGSAMVSCYEGTVTPEMAEGWRAVKIEKALHSNRHKKNADGKIVSEKRTECIWIRSTVPQGRLW